jgi:hypothetical protein
MSASVFWGQVAECRRLLRLHRQVRDEVRKTPPAWRFARRFLPWALIPLLGLPWWDWVDPFWVVLALLLILTVPHLSALRLTTFEALRMPSRRALYVARLAPWLPWSLWFGLWGTAGLLVSHRGAVPNGQQAALYLLIGAQVPWLSLGLGGVAFVLAWKWRVGWFVVGHWSFLILLLSHLYFFAMAGFRPGQAPGPYLALVPPAMLLLEIGLLALQVWAVGRMEPMRQQGSGLLGPAPRPAPARRETPPATAPHGRGVPGQLGPAPLLAGRHGLGWAAAYYALFKLRLYVPGMVLILVPVLAMVLFRVTVSALGNAVLWGWLLILSFWLALSASALHVGDPERLYLLGVDYRRQLVHRLRTFWVTPVLLAVSAGVLLAVALWGEIEMPLTFLALVVGLTLFGEGWFGWPTREARLFGGPMGQLWSLRISFILILWLGFLAGAGRWAGLPDPGWGTATRVQLFAAPCAALGLAGILYKWWRLDEATLRETMRGSLATEGGGALDAGA